MYDMEFADPTMTTWTLLRQTWIAANKLAETKLAKKNLTPENLAVLWICRDYPGPVTPAEIARLVFREAQSIAGLLNRMEKEGLVKRIPKRKGRPFTEIKLTAKGEELCSPGIEIQKKVITEMMSDLPDAKRKQLHQTLRELRQKMLDQMHMELDLQPSGLPEGKPIQLKW
jgi:DNA-binding MarR family transcriptional regulator